MSLVERMRRAVIPLEKIMSPWDDKRWLLQVPTPAQVQAAPAELTYYREHWQDFLVKYPDQGNRGTCVAWGNTIDEMISRKWQDGVKDDLSKEDLYWKARMLDGLPDWLGEGSNALGAMKARQKWGICLEATYPTSIDSAIPSPGTQKPEAEYMTEAAQYVIDNYYQIPLNPSSWKTSIAGIISDPQWDGPKPIVATYKCTDTMFRNAVDGILPEDPGVDMVGGHLSDFTDYKIIDGALHFGTLNTWGLDQGDDGWLWAPQSYLFNGIILEGWLSHYGPPITPEPVEPDPISNCPVAKAWAGAYNAGNTLAGGKTRLRAIVPRI